MTYIEHILINHVKAKYNKIVCNKKLLSYLDLKFKGIQKNNNSYCIPESFNTNISQQLFDYIITFVNSTKNTDSKDNFVPKKQL